ncbi:MAG: hypothetical protein GTN99_04755 [Candidatus Dadabacteria bacterium]|nr:hypothetical protein [Candidatus Dadabacteria bacterium]
MFEGIDTFHLAGILKFEEGKVFVSNPEVVFLKQSVLVLCILTIFLLAYKILLKRREFMSSTTKWLLLFGFVFLSPLAYFINLDIAFEESKKVSFCDSCHVMNGYVQDLKSRDSESIASLHFRYRWIAHNQCYQCHTDYLIFGPAKAKMSGIKHLLSYYLADYEIPIKLKSKYKNLNCLHCHAPVEAYQDVEKHKEYFWDLELNKKSCFGAGCHVSPHSNEIWRRNGD